MKFGKAMLALILCATLMCTACSTAWMSEAEQFVAALVPAAANIVALVAALGEECFWRAIWKAIPGARLASRGQICGCCNP